MRWRRGWRDPAWAPSFNEQEKGTKEQVKETEKPCVSQPRAGGRGKRSKRSERGRARAGAAGHVVTDASAMFPLLLIPRRAACQDAKRAGLQDADEGEKGTQVKEGAAHTHTHVGRRRYGWGEPGAGEEQARRKQVTGGSRKEKKKDKWKWGGIGRGGGGDGRYSDVHSGQDTTQTPTHKHTLTQNVESSRKPGWSEIRRANVER